ncbi:MAG: ATP-dependent Clp protease ATP-binding subunit [Spirochaetes bacterium]|nr:ATP-dependent Clp protease ATP-binding subunit [Spirochaetota bacterium]
MFQFHLTMRAKKVLEFHAQEEAKRLNHDMVTPEHVLLGLIREGEGLAARVLMKLKLDPEKLRSEIENNIATHATNTKILGNVPTSQRVQRLISRAADEARALNHNCIGTEHLLLGIMREGQNTAFNVMTALGFEIDTLRQEIMKMLGLGKVPVNEEADEAKKNRTPALDQFSRDLTKLAREHALDNVVGREKEVTRVVQILSRRKKNNPVLIGEPGVGKSAIVEGLAQRIIENEVPDILLNRRVLVLDLASIVAGTKYRGEFEERLKNVMAEIRRSNNVIVFIDELHTIIGAGGAEGAMDAANMLKPALARGELQCVGATTLNEYKKYIEKDTALVRRFQPIIIAEPSVEDTIAILEGIRSRYEDHHKVKYTDEALRQAALLSKRYIVERHLPDKAIDLIDEAGARARLINTTRPKDFKEFTKNIDELTKKKEKLVSKQKYEEAAQVRDEIKKMKEKFTDAERDWRDSREKVASVVDVEDILRVVSEITGIPLSKISGSESEKLVRMEEELHKAIIGQDEAIRAISRAIRRTRAGLKNHRRPMGSFIFLGPTGVGKTALAKTLADFMFGDSEALIRIDMSEFMEKHAVSRLIGAPPGYVGYDEGGDLTEKIRRRPYAVVLFDEIEKAHPDIFNILLQVLEEGQLTDNLGHRVDFSNTIIIMTSNVGARDMAKGASFGFTNEDIGRSFEEIKSIAMDEVKQVFNPEFINRVDDVVVFHTLEREHVKAIVDIMLDEVRSVLSQKQITLTLTEEAKELLVTKGYDKKYGARSLRRTIQREIEDNVSNEILRNTIKDKDHIQVHAVNGVFTFEAKSTEDVEILGK